MQRANTPIKTLRCDVGCHGVNFGAKKGGGYYAYVSSQFSNRLTVIDIDPNNDGKIDDARIAGRIILSTPASRVHDDTITTEAGLGGQGIIAIPNPYNGWIQKTVQYCGSSSSACSSEINTDLGLLTANQKAPGPSP
jgi:hypothetical protein